jgi:hypothetical protein
MNLLFTPDEEEVNEDVELHNLLKKMLNRSIDI